MLADNRSYEGAIVLVTLLWLIVTAPLSRALEPLEDPAMLLTTSEGESAPVHRVPSALPPEALTLEITESTAMRNAEETTATLRNLKAIVDDPHLRNGLNVHKGKVTNRAVADALPVGPILMGQHLHHAVNVAGAGRVDGRDAPACDAGADHDAVQELRNRIFARIA